MGDSLAILLVRVRVCRFRLVEVSFSYDLASSFFVALYTFSSVIALSFLLAFQFLVYHCCHCSQNTPYIAVYYIPYVRLECIK